MVLCEDLIVLGDEDGEDIAKEGLRAFLRGQKGEELLDCGQVLLEEFGVQLVKGEGAEVCDGLGKLSQDGMIHYYYYQRVKSQPQHQTLPTNSSFTFLSLPSNYIFTITSFYLMHHKTKLKEQQQSPRDADPSYDAYQESDSQQPNDRTRRPKSYVCRTVKQEFSLQNEDWLIRLVKLNTNKVKQVLEWIRSLVEAISENQHRQGQNITGLHFEEIEKNKNGYLIFMGGINENYSYIKVRDINGMTVSFKIFQNEKKPSIIFEYLKKIGNKTSTFIFDHNDDHSYIKKLTSLYNLTNLVFVSKKPLNPNSSPILNPNQDDEQGQYLHHSQNEYDFKQYKLPKKISIQETIEQYIDIQTSDSFAINEIFNIPYPQKLSIQSQCLLSNIIKSLQPEASKQAVLAFLQKGLNNIDRHMQRWRDSSKDHFPGPSISKRSLCSFCRRKKSEAICRGCTYVYNEEIHLCIRTCFQRHHENQIAFMKKQTTDICKNITFFDGLCKDISAEMNTLIEEEADEYLTFANYIQMRLVESVNKLAAKQNAVEEEEAETND